MSHGAATRKDLRFLPDVVPYILLFKCLYSTRLRYFLYLTCPLYQYHYTILYNSIVGVGKEGRTKTGPLGFLNRQYPFLELP